MNVLIEDLVQAAGFPAMVLTDAKSVNIGVSLPEGCRLHARGAVHIGDWNGGKGRVAGTVTRQKDGSGVVVHDLRYWPPDGGTLELDIAIDAVDIDTLRSDTLHSEWTYKSGPNDDFEDLANQTERVQISRSGSEVTLVLSSTGTAWRFASNY